MHLENVLSVILCGAVIKTYGELNPYADALRRHPWQSEQGYVEVRAGAHMFYWLYYADGVSIRASTKPLIVWVQGGPGLAATGVANFAEIGPLNMDMKPRLHTWVRQDPHEVKGRNVLLLDHPVGTGFSYVTNKTLFVKTDHKIAIDLSQAIKCFLKKHKEFYNTPTYIFGQSYGGKIAPRLGYYLSTVPALLEPVGVIRDDGKRPDGMTLVPWERGRALVWDATCVVTLAASHLRGIAHKAGAVAENAESSKRRKYDIKKGKLKMNLKGIGIGSGWVNPKESSLIYPQYLYNLGVIDKAAFLETRALVKRLANYIDRKEFASASILDTKLFQTLIKESENVNFNNINKNSPYPDLESLSVKINRYVKPTLAHVVNQSITWNYISDDVFNSLNKSFLVPSTKFLERLLNETKIKVVVYNGNLDVVTPVAGASNWAHKLNWHGAEEFRKSKRKPITGLRNGYYKTSRQFSFWWIFGAGHWVPEDNPVAMRQILDYMIESDNRI